MSTLPNSPPPTQSPVEAEYSHLISYFKWIVSVTLTAIGIVVGVGLGFFYMVPQRNLWVYA